MQFAIKKYFWVLPALTVVVCAVLAAQAVNYYLAGKFLGEAEKAPPVRATKRAPKKATATGAKESARSLVERNMFCAKCKPPEPEQVATSTAQDADGVPLTGLSLELVATNVASREAFSLATIRNSTTGNQGGYAIGSKIPNAGEVVAIRGKYVDFRNESTRRLERIRFGNAPAPAKPAATTTKPKPKKGGPRNELMALVDEGVKKTGETSFEIDRAVVDKVLSNPTMVARGARVVPRIKNGKSEGLKLYAVRPSSVFAKIGLKNGDVIQSINNFELTNLEKGLEIYTKLREANNLTVTLTRRGKPVTMTYQFK